jgi:hypothetical protein
LALAATNNYEQHLTLEAQRRKGAKKRFAFFFAPLRLQREIFADAVGYLTSCDPLVLSLA